MLVHTYNPRTWEVETERSEVQGQPRLHVSKLKNKPNNPPPPEKKKNPTKQPNNNKKQTKEEERVEQGLAGWLQARLPATPLLESTAGCKMHCRGRGALQSGRCQPVLLQDHSPPTASVGSMRAPWTGHWTINLPKGSQPKSWGPALALKFLFRGLCTGKFW